MVSLFSAMLYVKDAGPDESVRIQFWAHNRTEAQSRLYVELGEKTVILALEYATPIRQGQRPAEQVLSPGRIEDGKRRTCRVVQGTSAP